MSEQGKRHDWTWWTRPGVEDVYTAVAEYDGAFRAFMDQWYPGWRTWDWMEVRESAKRWVAGTLYKGTPRG